MLTDLACRRATPEEKPYKIADARGLYLYVLPSGYRSWRWKYRFAGKEKRMVFGPYPEISLIEARELQQAGARLLRSGVDPSIDKRQRSAAQASKAGITFAPLALEWHENQKHLWSAKHAADVLSQLERDVFPKIGKLPIADITPPLVLEALRGIEARGAIETARRARQRISDVFVLAIASGIAESDPAAGLAPAMRKLIKGKSPAVRTIAEARKVLTATEGQPGHPLTKLASRLLALTAVRSGVLRAAEPHEFEDLDGEAPLWRIPAAKMKLVVERKRDVAFEFLVPLSREAVETVKVAIAFSRGAPLIFHSVRSSRRPLSDSTISKAYRDAGYSGVHVPHGWRSTFSTIMNELAEERNRVGDRAIIDLMLAHVPSGVEATYNRAAYMPRRRELAQEWATMLVGELPPVASLLDGPRRG
jgi:integrase